MGFSIIYDKHIVGVASALFWLKDRAGGLYEAYRLCGSSDLFDVDRRGFAVDVELDCERFWRSWLKVSPGKAQKLLNFKLYAMIQTLPHPLQNMPPLAVYYCGMPSHFCMTTQAMNA